MATDLLVSAIFCAWILQVTIPVGAVVEVLPVSETVEIQWQAIRDESIRYLPSRVFSTNAAQTRRRLAVLTGVDQNGNSIGQTLATVRALTTTTASDLVNASRSKNISSITSALCDGSATRSSKGGGSESTAVRIMYHIVLVRVCLVPHTA
jgi:hypothetical protein